MVTLRPTQCSEQMTCKISHLRTRYCASQNSSAPKWWSVQESTWPHGLEASLSSRVPRLSRMLKLTFIPWEGGAAAYTRSSYFRFCEGGTIRGSDNSVVALCADG